MKIKLVKYIFGVLAFTFVLTGCSKNSEELAAVAPTKTTEGYVVKDGYLAFDSKASYIKIYKMLSTASELELKIWNENLPFKSYKMKCDEDLSQSNKNMVLNADIDPSSYSSEDKMDIILSSLSNEKGVLMCGDSIVKIQGEFIYTIKNGDFSVLDKIENNQDISNLKNVIKQKYSVKLQPLNNNNGMQKVEERTLVYQTAPNKRQFVVFEALSFNTFSFDAYIKLNLIGLQQTLFIFWQLPGENPLIYGEIDCTSTYDNKSYTYDGIRQYNLPRVSITVLVPPAPYSTFNLTAKFYYNKNNVQIGEKTITYNQTQF